MILIHHNNDSWKESDLLFSNSNREEASLCSDMLFVKMELLEMSWTL